MIAESIGREARRALLAEVIQAWVDDIPRRSSLTTTTGRCAISATRTSRCWPPGTCTLEVGTPMATPEFLVGAFEGLGHHKREALKLAGFPGR